MDAALLTALNLKQSAIDNVLDVIAGSAPVNWMDGAGGDVLNGSTTSSSRSLRYHAAFGADEIVGNLVPRRSRTTPSS